MKESDFFKQKNDTCERLANFPVFRSIDVLCTFNYDKFEFRVS